ncbi:glycosyltransferase [Roseobacter sp. YSTF-M11]|uniref:Glycosyltransferase n=1 Tax=Roseobacter insulae TaxID=2859783 RepID=A0A9X1FW78_9RHOB|nr:glycosyltransferase [Roseobacter insulae]MBW4708909.1 glycosyltransferase [Roseobacter insulae]
MPSVSFVIPAHQAASTLPRCLAAVLSTGVTADQVLVVDDGSTDETGALASQAGVNIVRNPTALRPARARNEGVKHTEADVVFFVDADVVVKPDVLDKMAAHFSDPSVTAVIGSYDDAPPDVSIVSRYRNLLHFFVHQKADRNAETFWTGIGAVRKEAFLEAGGFDSDWENIEDVEFGLRLKAKGGHILLDPTIQGTHLKEWTMHSMFRTDLWGRAVPWTQLIRAGRMPANQLNTSVAHKISAISVAVFAVSILAAVIWPSALIVAGASIVSFLAVNRRFLSELHRIGGARLAFGAIPYHAAHYVAALCGYAYARFFPNRG